MTLIDSKFLAMSNRVSLKQTMKKVEIDSVKKSIVIAFCKSDNAYESSIKTTIEDFVSLC
jgi:hypothetical protein